MEATAAKAVKQKTNVMIDRDTLDDIRRRAIVEGHGSQYSPLIEKACREYLARRSRKVCEPIRSRGR